MNPIQVELNRFIREKAPRRRISPVEKAAKRRREMAYIKVRNLTEKLDKPMSPQKRRRLEYEHLEALNALLEVNRDG